VDARNSNGDTPLHLAVSQDHTETAALLVESGADVDANNADDQTPLDCAISFGHYETAEVLGEREIQPGMAWVMAKSFVKEGLRSPSTASFGRVFSGDYQTAEDCVKYLGDGQYRATGWVDAENAFGAKVRTDFICDLAYVGDDKWRCTDLQMNQR
jgi:ankyrin repeat protein